MKATLTTILLTLSLMVNVLLVFNHFDKYCYQQGMKNGTKITYENIVHQIAKNKQLKVQMPDGPLLTMVPQRPRAQKPQVPTDLPTHVVVESQAGKEPNQPGAK